MITEIATNSWENSVDNNIQLKILKEIEEGNVIFLPSLKFDLLPSEQKFLNPNCADPKSKNISFDYKTDLLRGSQCKGSDAIELKTMIKRFTDQARLLVFNLFPHYQMHINDGRTSFRPMMTEQRKASSFRKDDSRLHIDSFASQPVHGLRLLRIFSNVNPKLPRVWKLGEPFENVVNEFLPKISCKQWISPYLLQKLKVTKSLRSLYDHLMLQIHDSMKKDSNYQKSVRGLEFSFPSHSTWIVMTDKVSHAALTGQYLLEQTFYLPVEAMMRPELSPLKILEKKLAKQLV